MSESYELTDEQIMVKDTVHRMAKEKIAPFAADIDESAEFPQEITEQFKNLGLFGLVLPETYGGSDMGAALMDAYGITGLPTTYIVDANGTIKSVYVGEAESRAIKRDLAAVCPA